MTMILDGTLGITATGSLTGLTTAITPAQGGTGLTAVGTSGNLLTSNGTAWTSTAPAASGGMTLLGTLTPTVANSISLGSLTLTNYKALFISFTVTVSANNYFFVNSSSLQSGIQVYAAPTSAGNFWVDLTTGTGGGGTEFLTGTGNTVAIGGNSAISTATTTLYFRIASAATFVASGSIKVYGVA